MFLEWLLSWFFHSHRSLIPEYPTNCNFQLVQTTITGKKQRNKETCEISLFLPMIHQSGKQTLVGFVVSWCLLSNKQKVNDTLRSPERTPLQTRPREWVRMNRNSSSVTWRYRCENVGFKQFQEGVDVGM